MRTKASTKDTVTRRETINRQLAFEIATEGIVLLENDGVLPLKLGKIALFGAGAEYTIAGGSGSGEVTPRDTVNVLQGLQNYGFEFTTLDWLRRYDDIFKTGKAEFIKKVRRGILTLRIGDLLGAEYNYPSGEKITDSEIRNSNTDTCLYVIARQSGEGRDRRDEEGSFRLDENEVYNIKKCAESYEKFVLVINTGCIIDLSPLADDGNINAIVYMGQLGMEGGNALAAVLTGKKNPSGKLTVSWANRYADYPYHDEYSFYGKDKNHAEYKEGVYVGYRYFDSFHKEVRYPFGYGLSYTSFDIETEKTVLNGAKAVVSVNVQNKGNCSGKEVVQVYASSEGEGEYQRLTAYEKTDELLAGETQKLDISFPLEKLSVYDEEKASTVIRKGQHVIRVGNSSRNTKPVCVIEVKEDLVLAVHQHKCISAKKITELHHDNKIEEDLAKLPHLQVDGKAFNTVKYNYVEKEETFSKKAMEVSEKLSLNDLTRFCAGTGLFGSNKGFSVPGAVGHSPTDYEHLGIPNVEFCDGPAGLRLQRRSTIDKKGKIKAIDVSISIYEYLPSFISRRMKGKPEKDTVIYQFVTAFPVAAVLAQSWNKDLAYKMGQAVGTEMQEYGVTYWLAPALNIVRNPLCGRNFEYYSEDPLISGLTAAAVVKGLQEKKGCYGVIKHFAANNQEFERNYESSDLDEKTLREIYLKGFEIVVREAAPKAIMSSYNKINGVYSPNSKDLCTDILRNEWGFDGIVMTDWFATGKGRALNEECLKAGNDLIMPGGNGIVKKLQKAVKKGKLSEATVRKSALRILQQYLEAER